MRIFYFNDSAAITLMLLVTTAENHTVCLLPVAIGMDGSEGRTRCTFRT